jgi:hypothetical protein
MTAVKHGTSASNVFVKEVVQPEEVESGHNDELDMKSEDLGTPLTSLTSRQSLPSDDTIFAVDSAAQSINLNGKHGNDTEGHVVTSGVGEIIDECDLDAEGEYEEDAEGELDMELIDQNIIE